jgi:hypothetical protein
MISLLAARLARCIDALDFEIADQDCKETK